MTKGISDLWTMIWKIFLFVLNNHDNVTKGATFVSHLAGLQARQRDKIL